MRNPTGAAVTRSALDQQQAQPPDGSSCVTPAVHVISPHAVYSVEDAIRIFRLRKSTIRREIREGRLRVSRRAGRYFLLGRWLIEWIEGGELRRQPAVAPRRVGERPAM
jgi:hypothetical protein